MAYQFGVLAIIVVWSTVLISVVIISIIRLDFASIGGLFVAIGFIWWYTGYRTPHGLLRRVHLLFREGVPLAPYDFRKNATVGYWLGIPIIYAGHAITAITLMVAWALVQRPVAGVPLGLGIGFALFAYSTGIGLVESSYRLWAEEQYGDIPEDGGNSPLRPVYYSIVALTTLVVGAYVVTVKPDSDGRPAPSAERQLTAAEQETMATANITITDLIAATYPGWTGEATFRYENTGIVRRTPATLSGTIAGGNTVILNIDLEGSSTAIPLTVSEAGAKLNGLVVTERSEIPGGTLRIVAEGESADASVDGTVRLVILVKDDRFILRHYVEQAGGDFLLRDEYSFRRTVSAG